jgi:3-dehydroquinate synthase
LTDTDRLIIDLGDRSYPIHIGPGLLGQPGLLPGSLPGGADVMLVSNETVMPLWGARAEAALAGRRVARCVLPDGEEHKTMATLGVVLDALVEARMNRDCVVVALGGGVVGDIAGFAAACYQRGVAYAQVPTTLLAQVDSSVGGKTGVNHPGGKNLIGAFHQPVVVVADTDTLGTLPDRELRAGIAEVIKYGVLGDAGFFGWLEQNVGRLLAREPKALGYAIRRSCEMKAAIVGRDEREQGERALLNLGHTFGHAIESGAGYGVWLHGEAVAAGMLLAAELSRRVRGLPAGDVARLRDLLVRAGLPVDPPRLGAARALGLMCMDKKVKAGRIRLVLLDRIGAAVLTDDYPPEALAGLLAEVMGEVA